MAKKRKPLHTLSGYKWDWSDAPEKVQNYVQMLNNKYPKGIPDNKLKTVWNNINKMVNPELNEKESEIKSILNLNRKQIETYSPAQKEALLDSLNVFSKKGYEQYTPSFMYKKTEEQEKGLGPKPFPISKSNLSDAIQNLEAFKNAPGDTVYVSNEELNHLKKQFGTTSPDSTTVYDPKTLGLKTIKKEKATPTPETKKKLTEKQKTTEANKLFKTVKGFAEEGYYDKDDKPDFTNPSYVKYKSLILSLDPDFSTLLDNLEKQLSF